MVDLQREARALGDPTRHRLFRHIAAAPEPVGVAELTDLVQLNHNDVAAGNPDTVCQLHLGLAEGLTEGLTEGLGGVEVERLVIHEVHQAGCRLSVQPVSLLKTPA
jgi:hypothetical protein